jgi:hypothetical protein
MKKIITISCIGLFLIASSAISWLLLHRFEISVSQQVPLPKDAENLYKGYQNVVDETSGGYRLVVYGYGSPPLLLKKDQIKINGYHLDIYRSGQSDPVYTLGGGEIDPQMIIDYSDFDKRILRFTSCVWDPRDYYNGDIPFVEDCVKISSNGKISISQKILLKPQNASKEEIDKLFNDIIAESKKPHHESDNQDEAYDSINQNLATLRNIALNNPEDILTRMKALPNLTGDCACQHTKSNYIDEVETIKSVLQSQ